MKRPFGARRTAFLENRGGGIGSERRGRARARAGRRVSRATVLESVLARAHERRTDAGPALYARGSSSEDRARPRVERGRRGGSAALAPLREPRVDLVQQAVERDGLRIGERRLVPATARLLDRIERRARIGDRIVELRLLRERS